MRESACQVRIDSYFSLPTDLAAAMHNWPEFVSGEEYTVELADDDEQVFITMVDRTEDDSAHVLVRGEFGGRLFLLALGAVSYELAAHTDDLSVMRSEGPEAIQSFPNRPPTK